MSGRSGETETDQHRRKILEMLSDAKISVAEAERLLNALGGAGTSHEGAGQAASPQRLRVRVQEAGGEKGDRVDISVPLSLIRAGLKAGMKFKELLPDEARGRIEAKFAERGIKVDLPHMKSEDVEAIMEGLAGLSVDVDGKDGEKVRVWCE